MARYLVVPHAFKFADLDGILRAVQRAVSAANDPIFERIIVPAIGAPLTLR